MKRLAVLSILGALAIPLFAAVLTLPQVTATSSYAAIATATGLASYPTYSWVQLQSDPANATGNCAANTIYVSVPGPTGTTGQPAAALAPGQAQTFVNPGGPEPPLYSVQVKAGGGSGCLVNVTYGTAAQ